MQDARHGQHEFVDRGVEVGTVFGHHVISALHGANCGGQCAATGVFKLLPWIEQWLMADYAKTFNLLNGTIGISDDPVPRDQLGRHRAAIADRDVIGEHEAASRHIGLFSQVFGRNFDRDFVFLAFSHGTHCTRI